MGNYVLDNGNTDIVSEVPFTYVDEIYITDSSDTE